MRCDYPRQQRPDRHLRSPVQTIAKQHLLTGLWAVRRIPERHNIIGSFINCRNLYELNGAFAPTGRGFDPQARAAIIEGPIVLVMVEAAIALQQTEATRILVNIGVEAEMRRIDQGTPDPFPMTGP